MSRLVLALLMLSPLLACIDPLRNQCSCTLIACFEGVSIKLSAIPDTIRYRDFSMAIAYGDTLEANSTEWGFSGPDTYTFTSPKLRSQRPAHVVVQIGYKLDGAPKQIKLDTSLAWQSRVCNHCSGNSSDCTDQMARSATMDVDLGSRL